MGEHEHLAKKQYFTELAGRLRRENIDTLPAADDRLPVCLESQEIGFVTPGGGMRFRADCLDSPDAQELCHRVGAIAAEVKEYRQLMEAAPPLKASSLDAPYKLLADFNGVVLGGMESMHGVQFTTWQRDYDQTGLTLGHYYGNNYAAAKQDFALRSGLVQEQNFFSQEQLTEVARCIQDSLENEYAMPYEREKLLRQTQEQISELYPDLQESLGPTQEQTM